jgi:nucleoid-associated protein YgaU
MEWRKSWAKNWDEVKYCSDRCRSGKPKEKDRELEAEIVRLLKERGAGKTICPSEAARAVAGSDEHSAWEALMEPARAAARRLVADGRIVITQGGRVVDGSTAKGAIRLRLR